MYFRQNVTSGVVFTKVDHLHKKLAYLLIEFDQLRIGSKGRLTNAEVVLIFGSHPIRFQWSAIFDPKFKLPTLVDQS